MSVIRTALAVGAFTMSVPVLAQDGRYGWDRARVERSRDAQGGKGDGRTDPRKERSGGRSESRSSNIPDNRPDARGADRGMVRTAPRSAPRSESRNAPPPDIRYDRRDRRDAPRVVVRAPVMERYDRRDGRMENRYAPYGRREAYRYGDRDFRSRDMLTITAWLRGLGPTRLSVYGGYDRDQYGVRYALRPGLYLSMSVFSRLDILPYDIEYELGELPWYLERRIYGRTVLVIDVRTRLVVDMYDIDD